MNSSQDLRAHLRRYMGVLMVLNLIIWPLALLSVLTKNREWYNFVILFGVSIPLFYIFPAFLKFRKVALDAGYTKGKAFQLFFFEGMSLGVLRATLAERLAHEQEWDEFLELIAKEEPQLLDRARQLHEDDRLVDANRLYATTKRERVREAEERLKRFEAIKSDAAELHCAALVWDHLTLGRLDAAESIIAEIRSLLVLAKNYGVPRMAVIDMIEHLAEPDFSSVQAVISEARNKQRLLRFENDFESQISRLPVQNHARLRNLLSEFLQLPLESRESRRALHALEHELRAASPN